MGGLSDCRCEVGQAEESQDQCFLHNYIAFEVTSFTGNKVSFLFLSTLEPYIQFYLNVFKV